MSGIQRAVTVIESQQDLDDVLAEMSRHEATLDLLDLHCNREIEAAKSIAQSKAIVLVNGKAVRIPERLNELWEMARKYAAENKSALIPNPDKCKSVKLTHGEIGWRKKRMGLDDVPELVEGRVGIIKALINAVIKWMKRFKLDALLGLKADRVFNVSFTVNKTAVLDLVTKQQITPEQLAALGLQVVGGEDEFWLKPAAAKVEAHTTAATAA